MICYWLSLVSVLLSVGLVNVLMFYIEDIRVIVRVYSALGSVSCMSE